jgi:hypothetical protein
MKTDMLFWARKQVDGEPPVWEICKPRSHVGRSRVMDATN